MGFGMWELVLSFGREYYRMFKRMSLGQKLLLLPGGLPAIYLSSFLSENLAVVVGFAYYLVVMLPIWWATIYDQNK
jgi:hypothetical protein